MTTRLIVKKYRGSIATMCFLLLMATVTVAQSTSVAESSGPVPQLVKFSGVFKDTLGHPKTGMLGVTFAIYKEQYDGAPLWLETQNVEADTQGNYSVLLGSTKTEGMPADLFSTTEPRWLGVQIEGQAEQPRVLFVSVPYALRASDAATIGGLPPSAFLRAPAPGASRENNSSFPEDTGARSTASGTAASTPPISGSGKTDFLPIWTSPSTLGNSIIFENAGKVGVGTTAPGPFEFVVNAPNQLGAQVEGPFAGVGAGLQLQTTGTGGKGWELLATGNASAQGPSKLNIRDLSTAADVFTIAPGGLVGIDNTSPRTVLQVTDNNVPCCAVGTVLAADAFKVGTAIFGDVTGTSGLADALFGQIFSPITGSAAVIGEANGISGQTSGVAGFNRSTGRFAAGVTAAEEAGSGVTFGVSSVSDSPNGTGVLGLGEGMSNTGNALVGC
ncbi:MAG: hypothetical protein JOZ33_13435, partial [Acidobacteriaceae bacterium]|nr:hypothetical protein [Acidobacteriaceae bacterium]